MALPVVIPNTFANANASIPLSQLDNNFSTVAVAINGMANGAEALANVNITGGSIANASLSNVSISSGNVTINVANVTTLDATNVEVTNIKAKDGTASATIADSTGVMTIGSSVLTTTDINGGTIDGTVIGGSTPAAGSFTTLSASANITATGGTITTGSTTALSLATSGGTQAQVLNSASANRYLLFTGSNGGNPGIGTTAGGIDFSTGSFPVFRLNATASSVNYLSVFPSAASGAAVVLRAEGSDAYINMYYDSQGSGAHYFRTGGLVYQVAITHTASANRYITLTGSNGGSPVIGTSAGDLAVSTNLNVNAQITTTYDAGVNLLTIRSSNQPVLRITDDGTTNVGDFTIVSGTAILRTTTNTPLAFLVNGSEIVRLGANGLSMTTGYIEGAEQTAPAAPAANGYRIYAEDNGSGKTRLMVKFATGAAQQIAIEP